MSSYQCEGFVETLIVLTFYFLSGYLLLLFSLAAVEVHDLSDLEVQLSFCLEQVVFGFVKDKAKHYSLEVRQVL